MFVVALTLLLSLCSPVFSHEFTADNSFLLNCPINSKHEYREIQSLLESGYSIDIFPEKVSKDSAALIQLLADEPASQLLLSRFGCYEEKGRASLTKLFTPPEPSSRKVGKEFHENYRSYQNMIDQLFYYSRSFPSKVRSLKSIGKTIEGRDLYVMHLTDSANELGTKPLVWIMAGQHAREWIAPASTFVLIEKLLTSPDKSILQNYEFAIMPLVNPDGYEYSRTVNRLWRKNRKVTGKNTNGVDLNRNWDHRWCEIGSEKSPRSDIYCGQSPASEPEIAATQQYILSLQNRVIGFDVHSYSQLILRNYGWTSADSPHEPKTFDISKKMSQSMLKLYGVEYTPEKSVGLYPVSGTAEDWLYVKAGIPGFVLEMRDNGRHGFVLPPEQIKPTGEELFAGIITAITNYKQQ